MATKITIDFFKKHQNHYKPPFLEIGSLIDPSYIQYSPKNMQDIQPMDEYIGIDIFEGEGVDKVLDLARSSEDDLKNWQKKFKTIHIHYVLEHVTDIFKMAHNIDYIMDTEGVVCISVPFSWKLHRIPIDMWRLTPQSVDYLFPNFHFQPNLCGWSSRQNHIYGIDEVGELPMGTGLNNYNTPFKTAIKALRKLKLDHGFFSERALLRELNLMMIGMKKEHPVYTFIEEQFTS